MGCKAAETACNITNAFGLGTANEHIVQQWFKKFCKGDDRFEVEKHSNWPMKVDNNQQRAVIKADPLTTTQEIAKELYFHHLMVIQHLKQIGKVKKFNKPVPHELTIVKSHYFEVSSSLILRNNEPFLYQTVTCHEKWILQDNWR